MREHLPAALQPLLGLIALSALLGCESDPIEMAESSLELESLQERLLRREANWTILACTPCEPNEGRSGISAEGDVLSFVVSAKAGDRLDISIEATTPIDTVLLLYEAESARPVLHFDDDGGDGELSAFSQVSLVHEGPYRIVLANWNDSDLRGLRSYIFINDALQCAQAQP